MLTEKSSAKKADKATDGALSELAREVGMLALEHRKSTPISFPLSDLTSIVPEGHVYCPCKESPDLMLLSKIIILRIIIEANKRGVVIPPRK